MRGQVSHIQLNVTLGKGARERNTMTSLLLLQFPLEASTLAKVNCKSDMWLVCIDVAIQISLVESESRWRWGCEKNILADVHFEI